MEARTKHKRKTVLVFAILLIIVVLPVFIYLTIRAKQVNGWDDWGFASAQTMLTARYWARDGFLKHKLLFIPSGYFSNIEIFDRPDLRDLTWGTAAGGLIGKRLYYTHYPSGYLIPYGFLAKLGFGDRFWFRLLALVFSFASVGFMFGFVYLITQKKYWIGLLAVFYYITSTTFLRFADNLNNIPIDDFFRWLILFLSIYAFQRVADERNRKRFEKVIWAFYFLLAVSSYDSTLFVIFWLCALTYIASRKLYPDIKWHKALFLRANIKKYFFWLSAPLAAFFLQMVQNVWYLGWRDMILDFWGAFVFRNGETMGSANNLPFFIKNIFVAFSNFGFFSDMHTRFALPIIILMIYLIYRERIISVRLFYFALVLIASGLMLGFVLPGAGIYGYQGKQLAPVLLIIFSIATYEIIVSLREKKVAKIYFLLTVIMIAMWFFHFKALYSYAKQWPNNVFSEKDIARLKIINESTQKDTLILTAGNSIGKGSAKFFEQFYADRLILSFSNIDELLRNVKKINSALLAKNDFLLIVSGEYENDVTQAVNRMGIYGVEKIQSDILPDNSVFIKLIRAI